jgi:DedD protein
VSTPFQNRIVGTIIVAAAAIIFLPDVLDGDKQKNKADFDGIPNAPKFETVQSKKRFPTDKLLKLPSQKISESDENEIALDEVGTQRATEYSGVETDVNNTERTPEKPAIKITALTKDKSIKPRSVERKLPEKAIAQQAWVIQLGSFRHKNNVDELIVKLKKNGYTAFTKPIKTKKGTLIKVFIGPDLIKSTLAKQLTPLKKLTNVQGKLTRFYPVE